MDIHDSASASAGGSSASALVQDVPQLAAGDIPADHDDRVHDAVDLQPTADERGRDGLHQVGHVVGDELDDRAGRAPPVGLRVGVEDTHRRPAGHPLSRPAHGALRTMPTRSTGSVSVTSSGGM